MNRKTKWRNESRTPMYYAWRNMRRRCINTKDPAYKNYGGRGIKVCENWLNDFDRFHDDMIQSYKKGLTLDRVDVNGHYTKENCRWITSKEQCRNKRNNVIINGKTLAEHAESMNVTYDALWRRLNRFGKTPEEAINPNRLNQKSYAEHGTRLRYERDKCRCDKCRAFNTKRHRDYLNKKKRESMQSACK